MADKQYDRVRLPRHTPSAPARHQDEPQRQRPADPTNGTLRALLSRIRRSGSGDAFVASPTVEQALSGARGNGRPLPSPAREQMESAFGASFEGVSLHTDADADQLTRQVDAVAFTHGRDIYFSSGSFAPETTSGKKLLAHELTHVVQQRSGRKVMVGAAYDPAETEADAVAQAVVGRLQRQEIPEDDAQAVRRQETPEEEALPLRRQAEADAEEESIEPLRRQGEADAEEEYVEPLRRQAEADTEEEYLEPLRRQEAPEEDALAVRRQVEPEEEEEEAQPLRRQDELEEMLPVRRQAEPEEEEEEEAQALRRQTSREEEELQDEQAPGAVETPTKSTESAKAAGTQNVASQDSAVGTATQAPAEEAPAPPEQRPAEPESESADTYDRGVAAYRAGELGEALDLFKQVVEDKTAPESHRASAMWNIGRIYQDMGDNKSALEMYRAYLAQPSISDERREVAQRIVERMEREQAEGGATGEASEAEAPAATTGEQAEAAETAEEAAPASAGPEQTPSDPQARADAVYQQGVQAYRNGELRHALQLFQQVLDIDQAIEGRRSSALWNIGRIYQDMGNDRAALTMYRTYLAQPSIPDERREVAQRIVEDMAREQAENPTGATEEAPTGTTSTESRAQLPADPEQRGQALQGLASQAYLSGDYATALEHFQQIMRTEGLAQRAYGETLYNMGQCYRRMGNNGAAIDMFRGFIQQPDTSDRDRATARRLIAMLQR